MKRILLSIFVLLMAFNFISCDNPVDMEHLTEDMIDEWLIGTWDYELTNTSIDEEQNEDRHVFKGWYEIEGIQDEDKVKSLFLDNTFEETSEETFEDFLKSNLFIELEETPVTKIISSKVQVNKEKTKIIRYTESQTSEPKCDAKIILVMTKRS